MGEGVPLFSPLSSIVEVARGHDDTLQYAHAAYQQKQIETYGQTGRTFVVDVDVQDRKMAAVARHGLRKLALATSSPLPSTSHQGPLGMLQTRTRTGTEVVPC